MAKRIRHYKDTRTGRYVSQKTWQRSKARGGTRYKRVNEKYTKPTKPRGGGTLPPPVGPIPPGPSVERLKYQGAKRRYDVEIISEGPKLVSVRVGRRVYTGREDFSRLAPLVEAARVEGVIPTGQLGKTAAALQKAREERIAEAVAQVRKTFE